MARDKRKNNWATIVPGDNAALMYKRKISTKEFLKTKEAAIDEFKKNADVAVVGYTKQQILLTPVVVYTTRKQ